MATETQKIDRPALLFCMLADSSVGIVGFVITCLMGSSVPAFMAYLSIGTFGHGDMSLPSLGAALMTGLGLLIGAELVLVREYLRAVDYVRERDKKSEEGLRAKAS